MNDYPKINPYARDAKVMPLRKFTRPGLSEYLSAFPNFSASGSISGMKKQFYGRGALLVKYGRYIYNVTSDPAMYYQYSATFK